MNTSMPMTKARINFGNVIQRVMKGERIMLEKSGIPVATIISHADLEDLEDALEIAQLREKHREESATPLNTALSAYDL